MEYHFAPLQGYTDAVFRETHAKHFRGVDFYYTPFCRVEKGEMRWHDQKDILPERNPLLYESKRLVPQIIANSADEVHILVGKIKELGYHRVDVNFGCPFPMIAKKQKGAGILSCPEKVQDVLAALDLYPELEFSVKMRLGMSSSEECMLLLPMINNSSIRQLTLHPRLGKDQYKGPLYRDLFESFAKDCRIPLLFNGDITSLEDIDDIKNNLPNLKGVMIGRGLLQDPLLVDLAVYGVEKQGSAKLKSFLMDLESAYAEHLQGGELQLVQKMVSYWEYLMPNMEHRLRKKILKSKKLVDYKTAIFAVL